MIDRPFELIGEEDLERLITNRVSEKRSLEYKESLPPGWTDNERKEFLGDVSSFANAVGDDLIFGVRDRRDAGQSTGEPESILGAAIPNVDAEIRRLESMLRDGIAPRIPGVQLRAVPGFERGPVLILRIPRSWAGPHMVTFQHHSRFYSRNAKGKYPLDVFEIRSAFLNSGSLAERAREFRAERLGRLVAADPVLPLSSEKLICIHAIPHASLGGVIEVDLRKAAGQYDQMSPFYSSGGFSSRFNIDGVLTHFPDQDGTSHGYLQLFRNGIIETVDSTMMTGFSGHPSGLPTRTFGEELFRFLARARGLFRALAIEPPISVLVSFVGVRGIPLYVAAALVLRRLSAPQFDRDPVLMPGLVLQDFEGMESVIGKPIMDALWQAGGLERCLDYNDQGVWQPR